MIFKPKDISDGTMSVPMEYQGIKGRWLSNELFNSQEKCIKKLERKLDIAVKELKHAYDTTEKGFTTCDRCGFQLECKGCHCGYVCENALKQIEEIK